ncbi:hypothetical protein C8F04DRAFT_963367 [Mycena alexandri]|uniref:Uncharacterized protein n=1 Tax=Mycena alexandri TaxID=1745969 RepID=A0AAD6WXM9_9AGAR|nr:hypothetical protein C8F04DRAFT_963367 [Mycena alexandri]
MGEDLDSIPACPPDAAAWFSAAYSDITKANLGSSFNALLAAFSDLERAFKWDKGKKNQELGKVNRPPACTPYHRGSRARPEADTVPKIPSLAVYERDWWKGWATLQPQWRVESPGRSNPFLRETYPALSPDNWNPLRVPGQNGMLSVVAALYWWGLKNSAVGEREDKESWSEAVADVKWMVKGMLAAEVEVGVVLAPE